MTVPNRLVRPAIEALSKPATRVGDLGGLVQVRRTAFLESTVRKSSADASHGNQGENDGHDDSDRSVWVGHGRVNPMNFWRG